MQPTIGIGGLNTAHDEYVSTGFDCFSPPEVESGIDKARSVTVTARPIASITNSGPYNFHFEADPEKSTNAESLRFRGKMRIKKTDGTNLAAQENVSTVNNVYHALISNIKVKANQTGIYDPNNMANPYKSYMETHLSYSAAAKDTVLKSRGYFKDTADKFDDTATANAGYVKRKGLFAESKWSYFNIYLHTDLCTLTRFLPPGISLDIEMQRTPDKFVLLTGGNVADYKIELADLRLTIERYHPSEAVSQFYKSNVAAGRKAILPIDRSVIKTYPVGSGKTDLSSYNFITGNQLPDQVIIGMVETTAYEGVNNKNPFNFQDFNLKEASLVVNGRHEPAELYTLDTANHDKADCFAQFLENVGVGTDDREFGIGDDDFYGGSFFLVFDRTPDKCNRFHRHIPESGTMDVNLKLHAASTENITVIVYATYSSDLEFDPKTLEVKKFLF